MSYRDRGGGRGGGGRGYMDRGPPRRGRGGGGSAPRRPPRANRSGIVFESLQEEREWVQERRAKRMARQSKFDIPSGSLDVEQTRESRRIHIGNLLNGLSPDNLREEFRHAIDTTIEEPLAEDPILNVQKTDTFAFIEFKTMEMATACMALDGLTIRGQPITVNRPKDYTGTFIPTHVPYLDVSKLGIVNKTVNDGPNKIFIGGLPPNLTQAQVMELLGAFGKLKAFCLIMESDTLSKGYCFVEYLDPNVTAIAVEGLNGMDIGAAKLTAKLAGLRNEAVPFQFRHVVQQSSSASGLPPLHHTIIQGYDVEQLVDVALGQAANPAEVFKDPYGLPLTRIVPMASKQ